MALGFGKIFGRRRGGRGGYVVPGSLTGSFALGQDCIHGDVVDDYEWGHAVSVHAMREGETLLTVPAAMEAPGRYRFRMPVEGLFGLAELVAARIKIVARSQAGHSGTLTLDGAAALQYAREQLGAAVETLCDIGFGAGGNATAYTGGGWSGTEERFTWTDGHESFLSLPVALRAGAHALRLTTGAMVPRDICAGQSLEILLDGEAIWQTFITGSHPQYFEIGFDVATAREPPLALRLHHPDAVRLADFTPGGDTRRLALSVRRLSLVRLL